MPTRRFASHPPPVENTERMTAVTRRSLSVIAAIAVLVMAITLVIRAVATNPAAAPVAPASPQPAAYLVLNNLKLYQLSERGPASPVATPPHWHALNDLSLYRASEWGAPSTTLTLQRAFHHLLLVK